MNRFLTLVCGLFFLTRSSGANGDQFSCSEYAFAFSSQYWDTKFRYAFLLTNHRDTERCNFRLLIVDCRLGNFLRSDLFNSTILNLKSKMSSVPLWYIFDPVSYSERQNERFFLRFDMIRFASLMILVNSTRKTAHYVS